MFTPSRHVAVHVSSDCPYQMEILSHARRSAIVRLDLVASVDDKLPPGAIVIDEYEKLPFDKAFANEIVVSSYCFRKGLCRKANLAALVYEAALKDPKALILNYIPVSFPIDTFTAFSGDATGLIDRSAALADALWEAEAAMENRPGKWILKPSIANKASEVFIIDTSKDLKRLVSEWRDVGQWVLQRYIERPLLLGGRKFHLRVYVLAVSSIEVYVYRETLALIAVHPYEGAPMWDTHAHITNTCANVDHPCFKEKKFVKTFSELPRLMAGRHPTEECLAEMQQAADNIYADIRRCIADVFAMARGDVNALMTMPNAFELYGVDFIVDQDYKPQLLEFNPGPDLKQTGRRLHHIMQSLANDMMEITVDQRTWNTAQPGSDKAAKPEPPAPTVAEPWLDVVPKEADGVTRVDLRTLGPYPPSFGFGVTDVGALRRRQLDRQAASWKHGNELLGSGNCFDLVYGEPWVQAGDMGVRMQN